MYTKCLQVAALRVITITIIFLQIILNFSCNQKDKKDAGDYPLGKPIAGMDTVKNRWGSWNVLLKPGLDFTARSTAILAFENSILTKFRENPGCSNYSINFQVFYCPCDSLLYNIGATPLDGSGFTVTSPPPPPAPGGSGDIIFASNNNKLIDIDDSTLYTQNRAPDTSKKIILTNLSGKINYAADTLAVIDTGIDPVYFSPEIRNLMISQTMYNVTSGNINSFFDDHPGKHGTVVTALALQALKDKNATLPQAGGVNPMPKLMVLKALDNKKEGSTFTVSCALSYALQHNASVINASLGYYDYQQSVDSVFHHYLELTRNKAIPVFAAAGNFFATKIPASVCLDAPPANLLNDSRMFYPACFSTDFNNLITVTSLTNTHASCFYQSYSSDYVTLGVKQKDPHICCRFSVPFATGEGTSFATPVACGTAVSYLLNAQSINDFIGSLNKEPSPPLATKQGQYMNYASR